MPDVDVTHPEHCPQCGRADRTTAEDLPWQRIRRFVCRACWASWDVGHFLLVDYRTKGF